jgi:hypothetical protein
LEEVFELGEPYEGSSEEKELLSSLTYGRGPPDMSASTILLICF